MAGVIAIIEDEEDLLELLEFNLKKEGYDAVGFLSTKNVKKFLMEENVILMLVDRNLPGAEGSEFVKDLRNDGITIPVIFLTAKTSEHEIIEGFKKGGDDYVTKPFNMSELLLRIKAILRRVVPEEEMLQYRDIIIRLGSRDVIINKQHIELTKLEFDLLVVLIRNKNIILSRDYLLENVWKDEQGFQDKTVNVAINRLKERIDPDRSKNYIKSVRGAGYTLC